MRESGHKILAEKWLSKTNVLVSLNLASTGLNYSGIGYITEALKKNESLIGLYLQTLNGAEHSTYYRNQIGSSGAVILSEYLSSRTCLL